MARGFVISDCNGCPFFERHPLNMAADFFTKSRTGTCKGNAVDMAFPNGRVLVPDPTKPPPECPLRSGPITIALGVTPK